MTEHVVTVSKVLHPDTGAVLALEIVDNTGRVFFAAPPGDFYDGLRANTYPNHNLNGHYNVRFERVVIARLERP